VPIYIEQLTINERRNFQTGREKNASLNENSLWSNERQLLQKVAGNKSFVCEVIFYLAVNRNTLQAA
jgi:hypothetical protein